VQLEEYVSPESIFTEYAYFASYSDSWLQHIREYTDLRVERFKLDRNSRVVELASNDGYLLQYFVQKGVPVLGIEPAANVAAAAEQKGVPTLVEFFTAESAQRMAADGQQADLVEEMARSCGRTARVLHRVERCIDEKTEDVVHEEPCVVLEGIVCGGVYHANCPREFLSFCREIWLDRVGGGGSQAETGREERSCSISKRDPDRSRPLTPPCFFSGTWRLARCVPRTRPDAGGIRGHQALPDFENARTVDGGRVDGDLRWRR